MARARNIKPGLFLNDDLAEIDPLGRILFTGLWCIADRRGRLEDRPKRIKAEVLPYDDCDVDRLLDDLTGRGFLIRYEHDGDRYIQITNFEKHQNPHKNEAESTIPPPGDSGDAPEGHHTSTVQAPEEHSTNPADSLNLIPDSLIADVASAPARKAATTPPPEIDLSATERRVTGRIKQVRGMAAVPDGEIAMHLRDVLSDRASPLPDDVLLAEAMRFRDYWQDKRSNQPVDKAWPARGWKRALTNWFTRTRHEPVTTPPNGLDRYEDWTGRYAEN